MKKYGMMTLAVASMLSLAVSAQTQMPQKGGMRGQNGQNAGMRQPEKAMATPQIRADRMATELKLNDSEKAKVQALLEKQEATMKQRRADMKKQRDEMRVQAAKERKSQEVEMEKILGAEKFKQFQSMRIEHLQKAVMNKRHGKMGNGRGWKNQQPQAKQNSK